MTPEQKMKAVVEAAGEKTADWFADNGEWSHFTIVGDNGVIIQSSPTDLNELFRLAEKLQFPSVLLDSGMIGGKTLCQLVRFGDCTVKQQIELYADTSAEALLNALYEATKETTP
jgi:hypothetical protein